MRIILVLAFGAAAFGQVPKAGFGGAPGAPIGAVGQILAGPGPSLTPNPVLGTDGSVAGTFTLANGSAAAHTIFSSAATTTNTIAGFASVPATGDLVGCVVISTTCTLTDSGVSYTTPTFSGLATFTSGIASASPSITLSGLGSATGSPSSLCLNANVLKVNTALTCTVSSARFKTGVRPMRFATGLLMKIRPEAFAYTDNPTRTRWGFIAEQVSAVDPKLGDGYDSMGPRSIDQNAILALAVKTIQEQERRIESLERAVRLGGVR